jgi:hypothetical protein
VDEHRELFEALPEGARPRFLYPCEYEQENCVLVDWYSSACMQDIDGVEQTHAHALIEHAARLHYEGEGYWFIRKFGGRYEAAHSSGWETKPMPLIDALLAAAEHAREGGGEK